MRDTLPDRVRLGVFEVDLRAGELREEARIRKGTPTPKRGNYLRQTSDREPAYAKNH
jgi:hypothetical protein